MEHPGREKRLQVWEGMKGFHGNLCLPVANVTIQIPQAPFQWTLKPTSQEASQEPDFRDLVLAERGGERPDKVGFSPQMGCGHQGSIQSVPGPAPHVALSSK